MTANEAIEIIKNEKKCVERADTCGRNCAKCELVLDDKPIIEAYDMAMVALKITSIVHCKNCVFYEQVDSDYGEHICALTSADINADDFCSKGKRMK